MTNQLAESYADVLLTESRTLELRDSDLQEAVKSLQRRDLAGTLELFRRLQESSFAKRPSGGIRWRELHDLLQAKLEPAAGDRQLCLAAATLCRRALRQGRGQLPARQGDHREPDAMPDRQLPNFGEGKNDVLRASPFAKLKGRFGS